jgi:oligopeptide/dipeptide ABC transporter ATP-binding protein
VDVEEKETKTPLLDVSNLTVHFPAGKGLLSRKQEVVHAVDGVSFTLSEGETLGIVGESGCGKTTTGMAILRFVEPTEGEIRFGGENIFTVTGERRKALRRDIQIIFQDPYSSLNPRMTLNRTLSEPMRIHGIFTNAERRERVAYLLDKVGLTPEQAVRYPHEFSGGQRQRIGIARALALNPRLVVGDEPVSALDVSIQAQIINLLIDLQEEFRLSYILIAHDLAIVEHICDRICVMYLGRFVESANYRELYTDPKHPYTRALLSAVPVPDPKGRRQRIILEGDVPSPIHPPRGCRFHPRCPERMPECEESVPALRRVGDGHYTACFLYSEGALP